MMLPTLTAIRGKYPDAQISWICGRIVEPLLRSVKGIDELIVLDDAKLFKGSIFERLTIIIKAWIKFFNRRFDYIITGYRDSRYKLLTLTARAGIYRSCNGKDSINSFIPGRYHALEYIKLFTGKEGSQTDKIVFPEVKLEKDPGIEQLFIQKDKSYVALTPGGANNLLHSDSLRTWPIENYRFVAEHLTKAGYKIILLGAKSDEWASPYFEGIDVINLLGKTSIPQLMNVLRHINLLISHDTGIFHLGKLFGTRTIVLFGPVNSVERVSPNENIKVITAKVKPLCAPCYDGKNFAECKNNICMKNIEAEYVFEEALKTLKDRQ